MMPGPTELILILVIILIVFGAGKLPQIGDSIGKGIRNFKRSVSGQDTVDVTPERRREALSEPQEAELRTDAKGDVQIETPAGQTHEA